MLVQNFTWNLCVCQTFQTNIATSLGLTLSPYFCLKHSMNKLRGDSVPKSTWLFGEAPSKVLANSLVAFFSSLRRSDISWLCPRQASHWVLLSLLVVIELVWQLLSIRKPTCYDKLCQLRCNSTKRKHIFWNRYIEWRHLRSGVKIATYIFESACWYCFCKNEF